MSRTTRTFALLPLMAIALAPPAAGQSRDERAIRAQGDAWQRYIATQRQDCRRDGSCCVWLQRILGAPK